MKRLVWGAIAFALFVPTRLYADDAAINGLKGKIFDANMAKQLFGNGAKFCKDLDGTNFFFEPRNRVLNLEDYHRSLANLAKEGVFNPETRRPWTDQDATTRWEQAKKLAVTDRTNCDLIANLPAFEKQLDDLQKNSATSEK